MTDKLMTVGDLIKKLKGVDPNLPIVSLHHAACKFYEFDIILCNIQDKQILAIEPLEKSETMFDRDIFKRIKPMTVGDFTDDLVFEASIYGRYFNCGARTKFYYDCGVSLHVCSQECLNHFGEDI